LGILVPIFEPIGWSERGPNTLLGFNYTWDAVAAIVISALLGILVSLSTFLVIGTTSSLTYNIVGIRQLLAAMHLKLHCGLAM
jgi:solute carrier family 35 protein E3